MTNVFNWDAPPLSAEDARLVSIYVQIGRPVDDLPYTDDFERLFSNLSLPDTKENRHSVFKRLLTLRKQGRLPSVSGSSSGL
jgi:hypothetical protein